MLFEPCDGLKRRPNDILTIVGAVAAASTWRISSFNIGRQISDFTRFSRREGFGLHPSAALSKVSS